MVKGGPFRCYNCGMKMLAHLRGTAYEVVLDCRRCKATVTVRTREPIPFVAERLLTQRQAQPASAIGG